MIDEKTFKEDYVDQKTAAQMLNLTQGRISQLCSEGRFKGATKIGWSWIIPIISIENFKPLRRGPKTIRKTQIDDRTVLENAVNEVNKWKEVDNNE